VSASVSHPIEKEAVEKNELVRTLELQCLHMGLHVLQRLQFRNVGTVAELLAKRQHED
jgi:hypothetical protein